MNKRGFELNLEFLLDFILGIICALLVLYVISLIYSIYSGGKEKALAAQTLQSIEDKINGGQKLIPLAVPRGWYIVSFEKGANSEKKDLFSQTLCADTNCLCICKPKKILGLIAMSVDCQRDAECKVFDKPFKEDGKDLYIKITNNEIEVSNEISFFNVVKK